MRTDCAGTRTYKTWRGLARIIAPLIAVLVLALQVALASGPGGPNDNRAYLTANGLLNRGLYELAVPEYERFLREQPEHVDLPNARYGLGVAQFRLSHWSEALKQFDQLVGIEGFGFAAETLLLRGHTLLSLGRPKQAAESFAALVSGYPEHESADDAQALLAEADYRAGRFKLARAATDVLMDQYPDSDLRERGELFGAMAAMALGESDDAAERLAAMLGRFPQGEHSAQATLLLARSLHRGGHAGRAIAQYQQVIDRAVESFMPEALLGLGQLLHRAGESDQAAQVLDRLLDQFADSDLTDAARLERGRIAFDQEKYDAAREFFEPVAQSSDDELLDDGAYWLAKCDLREGHNAEAAEALSAAIRQSPDSELRAEMTYDRAIALTRAGSDDAAIIGLEAFRSQFPDHPLVAEALYTQASIEHQRGNYDASASLCRGFRDRFADHPLAGAVAFLAAENEFLSGRFEGAEQGYRALLKNDPNGDYAERARFRLGMALYRQNRFDEAEPLLKAVVAGAQTPERYRPALLALGDGMFEGERWGSAEQYLAEYLTFGASMPAADDALLKRGLARQRQGRPAEAISDYELLLRGWKDSPHRLQAVFERGQALVELERWDDATQAFEQVLEMGGESRFAPYALNHLGALAQRRGEFSKAAHWFGRAGAIGGDSLSVSAQYERGRALLADGQYLDASGVLAGVVEQHPDDALAGPAQAYRAIALSRADHLDEALEQIDRLSRMDGAKIDQALENSVAYERAWSLEELGKIEKAAQAYRELLDRNLARDLRAYALVDLAGIEMRDDKHDKAAPRLEEALKIIEAGSASISDELGERAVYRLGVCRIHQQQYESAVELLDDFHTRFPDSDVLSSAELMCGDALLKLGQHARAAEHLERVVARHDSSQTTGPALLRLGEASATLHRWQRSREAFSQFLDENPESDLWFQARFGVGWALENDGDCDAAMKSYNAVVAGHDGPTAARAQFQIGECLFGMKRYKEAARELLKVDILYAYPQWSAAALYEAGRSFQAMGQLAQAKARFAEVRDRFGDSPWAVRAAEETVELERASAIPGR